MTLSPVEEVYQNTSSGDCLTSPGSDPVDARLIRSMDDVLGDSEAAFRQDEEPGFVETFSPVVEDLLLLVGEMSETIPLRATLRVETYLKIPMSG